jgi:hypothetical protein
MDSVVGEAERVKLGASVTETATVVVAVNEPEVPLMVTVTGLDVTAAEALAVRVSTSVSDAVPIAKLAVTPLGRPEAVNVTEPANPFAGAMVMVLIAVPPSATDTLAEEAESVKLGGPVTVSATVVVSVSEPDVPVMVTVTGLGVAAAEELAVRVSTSVSDTVPAAKLDVTPVGSPEAVNVTALLNPPVGAMVMVLVPVPPAATETLVGEADSVKLGVDAAAYAVINALTSSEPQPVASSYPVCTR